MNIEEMRSLGSQTAKNGFKNEKDIVNKFNNWSNDEDAQKWLIAMQYDLTEIEYVKSVIISGEKTDVQAQVSIKLKQGFDVENLQVKLVSNKTGFNQVDKRWVDKYVELWNIPQDVEKLLKLYTGELEPTILNLKDSRRMFINEFQEKDQDLLLNFLRKNKMLIISDILKGRGRFAAEWILVAQKLPENARWVLKPMNYAFNHYAEGDALITTRGNLKIGQVSIQRKGGDGGKKTAKMLQFKIDPTELFDD